ncbi:hypothetical protein KGY73_05420 [bacterium]|nr:hypothetical protein [bacterium]
MKINKIKSMRGILLILLVGMIFSYSEAQFYKVYGYETPERGETELVYWTSYIAQSDLSYSFFGKALDREGLWSHSLELEYGLTDRLTLAAYLDFESPSGENLHYVQTRAVFFRYMFAQKGEFFFDPAVYAEYYFPRKGYEDHEELEIRLILEKDLGNFRVDINPIFEKVTSGAEVEEGLEFNYAVGLYYRKFHSIQPGIEFHGMMGEMVDFKSTERQQHVLFPTVDMRFGEFHWHLGAGKGLTAKTDQWIFKSIISYEF